MSGEHPCGGEEGQPLRAIQSVPDAQLLLAFGHNDTRGPVGYSHTLTAHPTGRQDFESETMNVSDCTEEVRPALQQMTVRRLTPVECERLQGFPDGYTAGFADSTRYRMLGNAVAVPVVAWIFKRLARAAQSPSFLPRRETDVRRKQTGNAPSRDCCDGAF